MADSLNRIVHNPSFGRLVIGLILLTSLLVGIETLPDFDIATTWGKLVLVTQDVILWLFLAETLIKIGSHGSRPWNYFRDPWNVFDFAIIFVCFLPIESNYVAVFRIARVLRTLRLVTALPQLQHLVAALLRSIPSLGYVGILLLLHFYIYAVVGTFLFRSNDPVQFGTLPRTMLTLFEVLTLEAWPEYMRTQMYGSDAYYSDEQRELAQGFVISPTAWSYVAPIYFGSFIFLGAMIVLNMFTGIIIKGLEEAQDEVAQTARKTEEQRIGRELTVSDELKLLSNELQEVSQRMRMLQASLGSAERA